MLKKILYAKENSEWLDSIGSFDEKAEPFKSVLEIYKVIERFAVSST